MSASIPEPTLRPRRWPWITAIVVAAAAAGWFGFTALTRQHYQLDYTSYSSIEELGRVSDDVVIGTVVGVRGRFDDRGGDPEFDEYGDRIPGIPMVVYDVKTDTALKGGTASGTIVPIAMMDLGRVTAEGITSIDTGDPVLLFLLARTPDTAPDIATVADKVWVIVGGDNGILDVEGDVAVPRSPALTRTAADAEPQSRFELTDIEAALDG